MKFKKVTVTCTPETADTVAYTLHESGSMGEVFDDYGNIRQVLEDKRWDYADAALFTPTEGCSVSGFFTIETNEDIITDKIFELRAQDWADFSSITVSVDIIDSEEWENEWKKYYKPFSIGKIVVIPEWIDFTAIGDNIPVKLNPGLAFGTGMHETTSMCIDLMQKIELNGKRVMDFGCGSGILGICAKALGAESVLFADTDEQAITATEYNCKINGISSPEVFLRDVRELTTPSDVVVANITADVLIGVEPVILNSLNKGGYAIISGIISDKADAVFAEYSKHFEHIETERKNEWSAFLFKL
ncbi:MAG: 50S ribosomal protein L11 methyltransferase [Clostridiales bacterium]|nr:50S ribosomal protein L11 methyltransferase [Clostridiales bacterium]